jgi:hypothetical protein
MNAIQNRNDNAFWMGMLGAFCLYFIPWFIALVRGRKDTLGAVYKLVDARLGF